MKLLALLLLPLSAFAASLAVEGSTVMMSGSSIVKTFPAPGIAACKAEVEKLNAGLKRYCRTQYDTKALPVVVPPPPPPPPPVVVEPWKWAFASDEERSFTVYATTRVSFCTDDGRCSAVREYAAGASVPCYWDQWLPDPASGTTKKCRVEQASSLVPSAPPPPAPTVGSASLTWSAVTQNQDGTAAQVTGYRVEYGKGAFDQSAMVTGLAWSTASLTAGQWQFRVITLSAGSESAPSGVLIKVIP